MAYKNLLITLLLIPALAFGADEPSQEFLDTLTLAEQGDAEAQTKLGLTYFSGEGIPQNDVEALRW
jgi:TPR repeat protein